MSIATHPPTGNLTSNAMAQKAITQPKVGMGATLLGWTDRYAATITDITGGILTVQEDRATRIDTNGKSENQIYEYTADPKGAVAHYKFDNGAWINVVLNDRTKRFEKADGYDLSLGVRDHYFDFSF